MARESAEKTFRDQSIASVSHLRGWIFEWVSAAATVFGIAVVTGLLLYVATDALRPGTADPGWYVLGAGVLGIPMLALTAYYLLIDRAAGQVAIESGGVLVAGTLLAGWLVITFRELITPQAWLALTAAVVVGVGAIIGHARLRPARALERLFVSISAPVLTVFGIPALSVESTVRTPLTGTELVTISFSTPPLLPSVRVLVASLPIRPLDWVILVATMTLPLAYVVGRAVVDRRTDDRDPVAFVAGVVVLVTAVTFAGMAVGHPPTRTVLLATGFLLPLVSYLDGLQDRGVGLRGLVFPATLLLGTAAWLAIAGWVGLAGPDAWLDWGFMTNAASRTPADAGMYPALVGSVLILVVIALSAFPVGVGAAIYLEEYAPSTGLRGRIVELIEINIGNLAGVPSIVYGLLGLALFIQGIGLRSGIVLVGGLTVGLLILPIVILSAQEAIRAVPESRRQAAYGMGATRWQTVRTVVIPEAMAGVLTGTILAMGRAIGETAPLLMIGIASSVRAPPDGFFSKTGAMPRQLFSWSSEIEPAFRFGVLAAGVIVLLAVLLAMNGTAIVLRNKFQRSE